MIDMLSGKSWKRLIDMLSGHGDNKRKKQRQVYQIGRCTRQEDNMKLKICLARSAQRTQTRRTNVGIISANNRTRKEIGADEIMNPVSNVDHKMFWWRDFNLKTTEHIGDMHPMCRTEQNDSLPLTLPKCKMREISKE